MASVWRHHAKHLQHLLADKDELQAHLYLEQLMLFPVDIQDQIINDIANLPTCSSKDIAEIITFYSNRV
ncbi:hypothetical protein QWY77_00180 [Thalassotalea ponticola]|uniref:hypothetical protein n=1 Tax=Thalassotalea ponticola TaxID=1523392 RepID=UPI0025B42A74|nr:hypothetical protein [Thalassotalea ponticola]MDN3651204.1 hypothetical protein [Thalassotalea ponticola]